jgi:hypothetical protein
VSAIKSARAVGRQALAAVYGVEILQHALSLRAAGLNGKAPDNAQEIEKFVSTMTDNALWIVGTVSGLAILVIGCLHFFAHSRAGEYAAKFAMGALVLILMPGIAA